MSIRMTPMRWMPNNTMRLIVSAMRHAGQLAGQQNQLSA